MSNQNIVSLIFLTLKVLNQLVILLRYSEAVVRKCSVKKVFLNISQNSEESSCAGFSFSTKLQADYCRCAVKRLPHMCFPKKFAKFLRTSFLKSISGRLIMDTKFFQAIFYTHTRNLWNFSRKNF